MSEKKQPSHTMLYRHREGGEKNAEAWNLPLDTKIVEDGEIETHQADGWKTAVEIHADPGEPSEKPRRRRSAGNAAEPAEGDADPGEPSGEGEPQ